MRAPLAAVLCLGTGLMQSPANAQTAATPLPPESQARTVLTTSLLELLLALRLGPAPENADAAPQTTQPHLRQHAGAAPVAALAAVPSLTPP